MMTRRILVSIPLLIALLALGYDAAAQLRQKCPGARTLCQAPVNNIATFADNSPPIDVLIDNAGAVLAGLSPFGLTSQPNPPQFTGLAMSGLTFTSGSTTPVGYASATITSGTNAPTWAMQTSGPDSKTGATCHDFSAYFTINPSSGLVTPSPSAPAQSYIGFCPQATQAGVTGSPYSQAFTLTGNSAAIACDVGPPYLGPIPAPAQAAGYTHCANYDFTTASFSTISSWFQCPDNGSATANDGHSTALLYWAHTGGGPDGPCNDVNISSDGGVQVLDVTFTPTDFANSVGGGYTNVVTTSGYNLPNPAGTKFPNGSFIESVYRITQASYDHTAVDPGGVLLGGAWEYGINGNTQNIMEYDFRELYRNGVSDNGGSFEHCLDGYYCLGLSPSGYHSQSGYNATNYNSAGHFHTQDTSGNTAVCLYLNGSPVAPTACASGTLEHGGSDAALTNKLNLIFWSGAQNPSQGCGSGHTCQKPTGNVDVLYKRVTVWLCPNWQTTTNGCAGTVITTPP